LKLPTSEQGLRKANGRPTPLRSAGPGGLLRRCKALYVKTAILTANFLALFVLVNLALGALFWAANRESSQTRRQSTDASVDHGGRRFFDEDGSPVDNGRRGPYQLKYFDFRAYGSADPEVVSAILDDFHVNVVNDSFGLPVRRTANPAPQGRTRLLIFTFGGSTTFGYNVADEETWPSHLAKTLDRRAPQVGLPVDVQVVNYGKAYYYPSQEVVLLAHLLLRGAKPDLVVFLDGVNWGDAEDVPRFTAWARQAFREVQFPPAPSRLEAIAWLPLARFAHAVRGRLGPRDDAAVRPALRLMPAADEVYRRFSESWRLVEAICATHGIRSVVALQPSAVVNYPLHLHRNPGRLAGLRPLATAVYQRLGDYKPLLHLENAFVSFGPNRRAVIDDVHYSPDFNRYLAEQVAAEVLARLVDHPL